MAKVLIIDDQINMVDMICTQLQGINKTLRNEDIYYFDAVNGYLSIQSWNKKNGSDERRVSFSSDFDVYFGSVCSFLDENASENVLILIDVLLKSDNTNAPSIERYREEKEFSCELYAALMKIKNGKPLPNYNISLDKFYFLLYSRSEASNGVVSSVLSSLYRIEEAQFFPCECYEPENISWCKNQCEETDENNIVKSNQSCAVQPLILPDAFEEFIRDLK